MRLVVLPMLVLILLLPAAQAQALPDLVPRTISVNTDPSIDGILDAVCPQTTCQAPMCENGGIIWTCGSSEQPLGPVCIELQPGACKGDYWLVIEPWGVIAGLFSATD